MAATIIKESRSATVVMDKMIEDFTEMNSMFRRMNEMLDILIARSLHSDLQHGSISEMEAQPLSQVTDSSMSDSCAFNGNLVKQPSDLQSSIDPLVQPRHSELLVFKGAEINSVLLNPKEVQNSSQLCEGIDDGSASLYNADLPHIVSIQLSKGSKELQSTIRSAFNCRSMSSMTRSSKIPCDQDPTADLDSVLLLSDGMGNNRAMLCNQLSFVSLVCDLDFAHKCPWPPDPGDTNVARTFAFLAGELFIAAIYLPPWPPPPFLMFRVPDSLANSSFLFAAFIFGGVAPGFAYSVRAVNLRKMKQCDRWDSRGDLRAEVWLETWGTRAIVFYFICPIPFQTVHVITMDYHRPTHLSSAFKWVVHFNDSCFENDPVATVLSFSYPSLTSFAQLLYEHHFLGGIFASTMAGVGLYGSCMDRDIALLRLASRHVHNIGFWLTCSRNAVQVFDIFPKRVQVLMADHAIHSFLLGSFILSFNVGCCEVDSMRNVLAMELLDLQYHGLPLLPYPTDEQLLMFAGFGWGPWMPTLFGVVLMGAMPYSLPRLLWLVAWPYFWTSHSFCSFHLEDKVDFKGGSNDIIPHRLVM